MNRLLRYALFLLSLGACRSRSEQTSEPTALPKSRVPATASAQVGPAKPLVDAPSLPTSEDFEEGAAREISSKNLEQELDKLERELKEP